MVLGPLGQDPEAEPLPMKEFEASKRYFGTLGDTMLSLLVWFQKWQCRLALSFSGQNLQIQATLLVNDARITGYFITVCTFLVYVSKDQLSRPLRVHGPAFLLAPPARWRNMCMYAMIWYVLGACRVISHMSTTLLISVYVPSCIDKCPMSMPKGSKLRESSELWRPAAHKKLQCQCLNFCCSLGDQTLFAFHHGGGLFSGPLVRPWDKDTLPLTKALCDLGSRLFLTLQVVCAGCGSYELFNMKLSSAIKAIRGQLLQDDVTAMLVSKTPRCNVHFRANLDLVWFWKGRGGGALV